jgi:hypothetical protein
MLTDDDLDGDLGRLDVVLQADGPSRNAPPWGTQ